MPPVTCAYRKSCSPERRGIATECNQPNNPPSRNRRPGSCPTGIYPPFPGAPCQPPCPMAAVPPRAVARKLTGRARTVTVHATSAGWAVRARAGTCRGSFDRSASRSRRVCRCASRRISACASRRKPSTAEKSHAQSASFPHAMLHAHRPLESGPRAAPLGPGVL